MKIDFVLANSADPDEMQHSAAFHLGLHCLPKDPFRGFWSSKVSTPVNSCGHIEMVIASHLDMTIAIAWDVKR